MIGMGEELTTILVFEKREGGSFQKRFFAAVCPYCKNLELITGDVEIDGNTGVIPCAVFCGGCGMRGPWGETERDAVEKWNKMWGIKQELLGNISEWQRLPDVEEGKTAPF